MSPESLKHTRQAKGMNQVEFAAYLGVVPSCISNWESGRAPVPKMAVKLLRALERLEALQQPALPLPIPPGICQCGCQQPTIRNHRTDSAKKWVRGKYRAYVKGHNTVWNKVAK